MAAERALLTAMGVLDDPWARTMLTRSMAAIVEVAAHLPPRVWARSVTLAGLAARVLWFDAHVTRAFDSPVTQIAVIGFRAYPNIRWPLPD